MAQEDLRIKDLPNTKYNGFMMLDDEDGSGKLKLSVLLSDFTDEFTPNSTPAKKGKTYWYNAGLWTCLEDYTGPWDGTKFEKTSILKLLENNLFVTPVVPSDFVENKYVNSNGSLTNDSNFNVFIYDVPEGATISFLTAPGGGYIAFTDDAGTLVGESFNKRNIYTLDDYLYYEVPAGATKIRMTSTNRIAAMPTLVVHKDGRTQLELYKKLSEIGWIALSSDYALNKIPASTKVPVTRNNKNLFSDDLVGNFGINRGDGFIYPLENFPTYQAALIPLVAGNYTISGYKDYTQWTLGLWDKKFNRIAYKSDLASSDPDSLITIPAGQSWGSADYINVTAPKDCFLIINFYLWYRKHLTAKVQVEQGTTPTSYVRGIKLFPNYVQTRELEANKDLFLSPLYKIPASTIIPVRREFKNLFSKDYIGNFTINASDGTIVAIPNMPSYKGCAIPLAKGEDYVISGYAGDWRCIGLWSNDGATRYAVRCNAVYASDTDSLLTIPEGETWLTATKYYVHAPENCLLVIGFSSNLELQTSSLQVELGSTPTSYERGIKLFPNYAQMSDLGISWAGKKLLIIGDSITDGNKYTTPLASISGCSIYNRGVGGSCIAVRSGSTSSFCERFDLTESNTASHNEGFPNRSNIDAVIVFGGTNDWGVSIPMGTLTGTVDTSTFYGALKYLLNGLKTRYYGKPIILLSLMNAARSTRFTAWNRVEFNNDGSFTFRTNSQGVYMSDYHKAEKEVCDLFGVPFVDMFECGLSPFCEYDYENLTLEQGDPLTPDGLHPNEAGGHIMAQYIYGKLKNIFG